MAPPAAPGAVHRSRVRRGGAKGRGGQFIWVPQMKQTRGRTGDPPYIRLQYYIDPLQFIVSMFHVQI